MMDPDVARVCRINYRPVAGEQTLRSRGNKSFDCSLRLPDEQPTVAATLVTTRSTAGGLSHRDNAAHRASFSLCSVVRDGIVLKIFHYVDATILPQSKAEVCNNLRSYDTLIFDHQSSGRKGPSGSIGPTRDSISLTPGRP